MQKFCVTVLNFEVAFKPLNFCVSLDQIFSQSQFQEPDFNWRQLNAKGQIKNAQKLFPFFTLNLNSGKC